MAARAIWKAVIRLAAARLPVKLYSAAEDRTVHFRLLHDQDHVPVQQRMVHPVSGEVVEKSEIRKAAAIDDGRFVVMREDEIKSLEPAPSREIEIKRCVPLAALGHQWYQKPYYLGPDGAEGDYWALVEALQRSGRQGIARWVMRGKRYAGALRVHDEQLMLISLRFAEQILPLPHVDSTAKGSERERNMAQQLVDAMADQFRPQEYKDTYRQRLLELIERKARGEEVTIEPAAAPPAVEKSFEQMLEASLKDVREPKRGRAA